MEVGYTAQVKKAIAPVENLTQRFQSGHDILAHCPFDLFSEEVPAPCHASLVVTNIMLLLNVTEKTGPSCWQLKIYEIRVGVALIPTGAPCIELVS